MTLVKAALLGCGGWGKNLARNLAQLDALAVIVDPDLKAAALAQELGVRHVTNAEDVLADPEIEAVVIATPAATHFVEASRAITAGKHVYVEKPIALNVNDATKLADLAKKANRHLMVGHLLQYHPSYQDLRALAQAGRFGKIRHINSSRLNLGLLRHEENVLWSFSPHDVSMVLGLAAASPISVMAIASIFLQNQIPDITAVHIRFGDGSTAEIRASWLHPEKEQKLILVGETAMAVFNDRNGWEEKLLISDYTVTWDGPRPRAVRGGSRFAVSSQAEPLKLEMQHFLDCITNDTPPITDAVEAIAVLRVLQAAQQSLEQAGKWIDV